MAALSTYHCANCDYSVQMSGKPDALMSGETIPCVCTNCKSISDRLICFFPEGAESIEPDPKCYNCGSKSYELWDYKNKPCPRCEEGTMKLDKEGDFILAD